MLRLHEQYLIPFVPDAAVPVCGVMVDNGSTDLGDGVYALATRISQVTGERPIYVNSPIAVPADGHGICCVPGPVPLWVAYDDADGTPAIGEVWGPVKSSFKLRKGIPGFKILAAGQSGIVWAKYDEVGEPSIYGKLDGTLSPGGSATVSLYWLSGGTWTDTTINETAYAPPTFSTGTIATAKWVRVKWISQSRRLEVVNAEC